VAQLQLCVPKPAVIIVVDSSDNNHPDLADFSGVKYLYSSHKNQPYQRFLGATASKADYVLFLDDDMEVVDYKFIEYINNNISNNINISGLALHFENKDNISLVSQMPKSRLKPTNNILNKLFVFIKVLSGYPVAKPGCFLSCGIRGLQPVNGGETQWVSGGAFLAKRNLLFINFNYQLIDLFEKKIGMGEDVIIGFTLKSHGKLIFVPKLLFIHNDQKDSSYTLNLYTYGKRVVYSRLYLTLERARLLNKSILNGHLYYHWHILWRIVGQMINFIAKPTKSRFEILKGSINGWLLSFGFKFDHKVKQKTYWLMEIEKDLANNHFV
jgi:hypothetical protein